MRIAPNRLVTVLTPLVFAPLAGAVSVFAAEHLPGLDIDSDQVQQIFIAGALIAFGKAGLWLKGWQDWEKRQDAAVENVASDVDLAAPSADDDPDTDDEPALADLDPDTDVEDEDDDEDDETDLDGVAFDDGFAAIGRD